MNRFTFPTIRKRRGDKDDAEDRVREIQVHNRATIPRSILVSTGTVRFDLSAKQQYMFGFGGSIACFQDHLARHPNADLIYDAIFAELMPSILRLRNSYRQPLEPYYSDADLMAFDKDIVDAARARLPGALTPKVLMTSWTAPAEMKQNRRQKGGDPSNVLRKRADGKFMYKEFAEDYWLPSLYAYSKLGIKPRWIRLTDFKIPFVLYTNLSWTGKNRVFCDLPHNSIQNEPDYDSAEHESCVFSASENFDVPGYYKAFDVVYDTLSRNMADPPGMIGPETSGFDKYIDHPYAASPRFEAIGNHLHTAGVAFGNASFFTNLDTTLEQARIAAGKAQVKKLFVTESANLRPFHPQDPILLVRAIYRCLEVAQVGMYLSWDLIWSRCTNLGTLLVVDNPFSDRSKWGNVVGFTRLHSFYWFQHFTNFVREGMFKVATVKAIDTPSNVLPLCFIGDDGSVAVILINEGTEDVIISLPNLPPSLAGRPYRRFFSTLTQVFTEDPAPFAGSVELPAESITTIYNGKIR